MPKVLKVSRIDLAVVALLSALTAMPALAQMPVDIPFVGKGLPMRDWILIGSLALLAVALAFRLMRHRDARREPAADSADMRWWRND